MPTLVVAIDASRARQGAQEATDAINKVRGAARGAEAPVDDLGDALKRTGQTGKDLGPALDTASTAGGKFKSSMGGLDVLVEKPLSRIGKTLTANLVPALLGFNSVMLIAGGLTSKISEGVQGLGLSLINSLAPGFLRAQERAATFREELERLRAEQEKQAALTFPRVGGEAFDIRRFFNTDDWREAAEAVAFAQSRIEGLQQSLRAAQSSQFQVGAQAALDAIARNTPLILADLKRDLDAIEQRRKDSIKTQEAVNRVNSFFFGSLVRAGVVGFQELDRRNKAWNESLKRGAAIQREWNREAQGVDQLRGFMEFLLPPLARYAIQQDRANKELAAWNKEQERLRSHRLNIEALERQAEAQRKMAAGLAPLVVLLAEFAKQQADVALNTKKANDALKDTTAFLESVQLETELIGLSNEEAQKRITLRQFDAAAAGQQTKEILAQRDALEQLLDAAAAKRTALAFAQTFGSAFEDFIVGAKNAKQAAEELLRSLLRLIVQQQVTQPLVQSLTGLFAGGSAQGNVFSGGQTIAMASGGIVTGPTFFPLSGGRRGVMGEAGPEAVLPLKRGPGGKLGVVAADGGGGRTVNIVQNFRVQGAIDRKSRRQIAQDTRRAVGE